MKAGDSWQSIAVAPGQEPRQRRHARDHERPRGQRAAAAGRPHQDRRRRGLTPIILAWPASRRRSSNGYSKAWRLAASSGFRTSPTSTSPCPTSVRSPRPIPATTAFMELRKDEARDGRPGEVSDSPAVGALSPDLAVPEARGARHRRRRLLRPRRHRSRWSSRHRSKKTGKKGSSCAAPAPSPSSWPRTSTCRRSRNPMRKVTRAAHHAPARSGAHQAAHLRDLPEHDRVGRRHLRLRGRGPRLFRQVVRGARHRARRRCWPARSSTRACTARPGRRAGCCAGSRSSCDGWESRRRRRPKWWRRRSRGRCRCR